MRAGAARLAGALVEHGRDLDDAGLAVLDEVGQCDGAGVLIAVDADGRVSWPFSTDAMPRGALRPGEAPTVEVP